MMLSSAVKSYQPSLSSASRRLLRSAGPPRALSTGPPWKPMLIFWGLSLSISSVLLRWLHDLGKHPAGGSRVKEGHARAADPGPGAFVDQPHAGGGTGVERLLDRSDAVGDVV